MPLPSSAPRATGVSMDHQALTTARQIVTVLGIDLDQVQEEESQARVEGAAISDRAELSIRAEKQP